MNFYVINNHLFDDSKYAFGEEAETKFNADDAVRCTKCGAAMTSLQWLPPYDVKLSKSVFGDFVFGTIEPFLVSELFKTAYDASGLIGITEFNLVKIKEVNGKRKLNSPPNYFYARVGISEAQIDEKKSKLIRTGGEQCDQCKLGGIISNYQGLYLDEDTWSGEDIFYAKGLPGVLFVTERFKDFVDINNYTNLELVASEKATPQF